MWQGFKNPIKYCLASEVQCEINKNKSQNWVCRREKYPTSEKWPRTYRPWVISLTAAKMSTPVKYKKLAVISLIVGGYIVEEIILACTLGTDSPFKIQIPELELFFCFNLPAVISTSETGQLEIINHSKSFIFFMSRTLHIEVHLSPRMSIKESRNSWSNEHFIVSLFLYSMEECSNTMLKTNVSW